MAKRQGKGRTRKAARQTSRKAARKISRPSRRTAGAKGAARKGAARKRAARKTAARTSAARRTVARKTARVRASRPAPRRSTKAAARRTSPARKASPKTAAPPKRAAAPQRPKPAALERERRQLRDDETVLSAPSTLGYAAKASSAESGHQMYRQRQKEHTEGGSTLTGGEVDTDWNDAYSSGEEAAGGDMSTPDQDVVEEIGRALGVEYQDAEELKGAEKIEDRDRHRWEYDPASAEDYRDRTKREED